MIPLKKPFAAVIAAMLLMPTAGSWAFIAGPTDESCFCLQSGALIHETGSLGEAIFSDMPGVTIPGCITAIAVDPAQQTNVQLPKSCIELVGLPNESVFIYGDTECLAGGIYNGLYLSINGITRREKWKNLVSDSFPPKLTMDDMDGDGKKELAVVLTTGEGTGVYHEEIHVVDPENFEETAVTDPLDIIGQNTGSSIVHSKGIATITITINGQQYVTKLDEDYGAGKWFKEAAYGNFIKYEVVGGKLKAKILTQVSNTFFIGEINITYIFSGGQYIMETIGYTPYDLVQEE